MSKIDNVQVYGLEESIIASGYSRKIEPYDFSSEKVEDHMDRAEKLAHTSVGGGHDQFLSTIVVQFDLTFPLKAWVELQRYHFIEFCTSMSTMYKITKMDLDKCCNQYVDKEIIKILQEKIKRYDEVPSSENFYNVIYNIPSGLEYTARLSTNYRQLKTIYNQRKNHKLPDWHVFCDFIKTLPHSEFIIGE